MESLNLSTLEWTTLPNLPTDVTHGKLVYDGDDLVLVNGDYGNFLRFNPGNRTFSVIPGPTMPGMDYGATVLAIVDDQLSGCARK